MSILNVFKTKYEEDDRIINAIYALLETARLDLKNYNKATEVLGKKNPPGAKAMSENKVQNKIAILSKLKKDINKILREF